MPDQRMTLLAACAGLLVTFLGIVPTMSGRAGNAAGNTAAFDAVQTFSVTAAELLPLGLLVLAAAVILSGVGVFNS